MNKANPAHTDASTESTLLFALHLLHRSFSQNLKYEGNNNIEPAQMSILMSLSQEAMTLTELAKQICVKPPTASRSVNLLVNAGLVTRTVPESNRRVTLLSLTPDGVKKMALIKEKAELHVSTILESLSSEDRFTLDAGLKALITALHK